MKILHWLHTRNWGGLEKFVALFACELQKQGCKNTIFFSQRNGIADSRELFQNSTIELRSGNHLDLWQNFREQSPDTIIHYTGDTMHAAWLAGLLRWPENHIRIFMHGFGRKQDIYHHCLYQKFNCIFPTRLTHSQSKKWLPIPEARSHFQYFGVPLARKVQKKSWDSPLTLVSLSRIEPAKRIRELVEAVASAFQKNPNLQERFIIKIFGKPHGHDAKGQEYLQQLRQMVPHHLTTKILFPGFTNEPNLILEKAHFLFFTSQNEFYGFSLLEALATGTPTITVTQGSFTELNHEDYGCFIDLENPRSVQKVLEEISAMSALEYETLQEKARNRAEAEFDISKTTDQFRQWLITHYPRDAYSSRKAPWG